MCWERHYWNLWAVWGSVCVQVWQEEQFSYPVLEEETEIPLSLQKGLSPRAGEWVSGMSVLEVPSQLVPGALSPGT